MRSPRFLFACLLTSLASFFGTTAIAQVIPDQTLGSESSVVIPNVEVDGNLADRVDGGAARGPNLFHSFSEFSIGEGEKIYFSSPADIENIFSRVTGGDITTVEGLLGTTGDSDATLILINPNGLVFGENAGLDVQGSFTATTAAGVKLGETGMFSATAPNTDDLLAIRPSAFFFQNLGARPTIEVTTQGQDSFFPNERFGGMSVSNGESISLIGGDVLLENATIEAHGGQVFIGSALEEGEVDLSSQSINFSNNSERGDIKIDNSFIDVRRDPSGSILLFADNIDIMSESRLLAGSGADTSESRGGSVTINADSEVTISNSTLENVLNTSSTGVSGDISIESQALSVKDNGILQTGVRSGATGSSGNIILNVGTLSLNNRSAVRASSFGQGDAGDVSITSDDAVTLNNSSSISSTSGDNAIGNGGDLKIMARSVEILNGSTVFSFLSSTEADTAGNIDISVEESLIVRGQSEGFSSFVASMPLENATGSGGTIHLMAPNISIDDLAIINVGSFGQGNGGRVQVVADSLGISNSASFRSAARGSGNAGDIELDVARLNIDSGGFIATETYSSGKGGEVVINASELINIGGAVQNPFMPTTSLNPSGITANTFSQNEGKGGSVSLVTESLRISDGALVSADTLGDGEGGNITVVADSIEIVGGVPSQSFSSSISTDSERSASGNAGDITISVRNLSLLDGGFIASSARSGTDGSAGNISISSSGDVEVVGTTPDGENPTGISVSVEENSSSNAGSITISARTLSLREGGSIFAQNEGVGNQGSIDISAEESIEVISGERHNSRINSVVNSDRALANNNRINIRARRLRLLNGGQILTNTTGSANASDIIVNATDFIQISGVSSDGQFPSGLSAGSGFTQFNRVSGEGGDITIQTDKLEILDQGEISSRAFGRGNSGNVSLILRDLSMRNGSVLTSSVQSTGGSIQLVGSSIRLFQDSDITTSVNDGIGKGGNITIDANSLIAFDDSDILAFANEGSGGDIDLVETAFFSENFIELLSAASGQVLKELDRNDRVDINADGQQTSGTITIQNSSLVENDLTELSDSLISSETLIVSSCIERTQNTNATIVVSSDVLPSFFPTMLPTSPYPTGTAQSVPTNTTEVSENINNVAEPQVVYRTSDGRFAMSQKCD